LSGTNKAHGLRRSNEDKRCVVEAGLAMKPKMSDRAKMRPKRPTPDAAAKIAEERVRGREDPAPDADLRSVRPRPDVVLVDAAMTRPTTTG
jgi:hypothetical protein